MPKLYLYNTEHVPLELVSAVAEHFGLEWAGRAEPQPSLLNYNETIGFTPDGIVLTHKEIIFKPPSGAALRSCRGIANHVVNGAYISTRSSNYYGWLTLPTLFRTITHEIGHLLGAGRPYIAESRTWQDGHCTNKLCVMSVPQSQLEQDIRTENFCSRCAAQCL